MKDDDAILMNVTDVLSVEVIKHPEHQFLMTTKQAAIGYGVEENTIRMHKKNHSDELKENKHWCVNIIDASNQKSSDIFWTLRGIIRLGFFIKSDQAVLFRDWAEDTLYDKITTRKSVLSGKAKSQKELSNMINEINNITPLYQKIREKEAEIMRYGKVLKEMDVEALNEQLSLFN